MQCATTHHTLDTIQSMGLSGSLRSCISSLKHTPQTCTCWTDRKLTVIYLGSRGFAVYFLLSSSCYCSKHFSCCFWKTEKCLLHKFFSDCSLMFTFTSCHSPDTRAGPHFHVNEKVNDFSFTFLWYTKEVSISFKSSGFNFTTMFFLVAQLLAELSDRHQAFFPD